MDAHDGKVIQWETGGPYYWYGTEYGNVTEGKSGCSQEHRDAAGFRSDHNVSVSVAELGSSELGAGGAGDDRHRGPAARDLLPPEGCIPCNVQDLRHVSPAPSTTATTAVAASPHTNRFSRPPGG